MNIAVVGGGQACMNLMELVSRNEFDEFSPRVIAVAERNSHAPALEHARGKGIYTTTDYNEFFSRDDIDLIVELTGSSDIFTDIIRKKKKNVMAIDINGSQLFYEIFRVSDIQRATNQKLKKAEAMFKMVVNELIQEDVMVIAKDYSIIDINTTLLDKLGLKKEEVVGRFCYEITHRSHTPCSGQNHPCPLCIAISQKKPSQVTHIHYDKDKRPLYYSISCYPMFEGDDVIGAIEISRDITRDINLQKTMMQQEKLASIGRLAAGVAHEINNPMTTILTSAMLVQEEMESDDPNYDELQTIADETLRCRKIVTSLLDFARQTKPDKKWYNVNEIIQECLILTRKQAAFNDVTVSQELLEDMPSVFVDKDQIQQAIINLALNAIEATPPGGVVKFSTSCNDAKNIIEIRVADTGSGIPNDIIEKVFDPFFTTKESGTGLGLAITHGIIEQHNGAIDVQSDEGKGTTFFIRLPAGQGDDDAG